MEVINFEGKYAIPVSQEDFLSFNKLSDLYDHLRKKYDKEITGFRNEMLDLLYFRENFKENEKKLYSYSYLLYCNTEIILNNHEYLFDHDIVFNTKGSKLIITNNSTVIIQANCELNSASFVVSNNSIIKVILNGFLDLSESYGNDEENFIDNSSKIVLGANNGRGSYQQIDRAVNQSYMHTYHVQIINEGQFIIEMGKTVLKYSKFINRGELFVQGFSSILKVKNFEGPENHFSLLVNEKVGLIKFLDSSFINDGVSFVNHGHIIINGDVKIACSYHDNYTIDNAENGYIEINISDLDEEEEHNRIISKIRIGSNSNLIINLEREKLNNVISNIYIEGGTLIFNMCINVDVDQNLIYYYYGTVQIKENINTKIRKILVYNLCRNKISPYHSEIPPIDTFNDDLIDQNGHDLVDNQSILKDRRDRYYIYSRTDDDYELLHEQFMDDLQDYYEMRSEQYDNYDSDMSEREQYYNYDSDTSGTGLLLIRFNK